MRSIKNILSDHANYRNNTINLIPSENVMSPEARRCMGSDMGHRYFFKNSYKTSTGINYEYRGTRYIEEVYDKCVALAGDLFGANYVEVFPISGHMSNLSILTAFTRPGDTIMVTSPDLGGYPGLAVEKLPRHMGLETIYIPSESDGIIDTDAVRKTVVGSNVKVLFLTSSWTLFPIPLDELSEICRENHCVLVYDASHPLGLIAGGQFQDPLREGADYMVGSTHKTLPGPQGGIILGNESDPRITEAGHFITADNIHYHRIAALAQALEEMLKYGKDYAEQVIKNARTLAKELYDGGFPVMHSERGFTSSHQIKLDIGKFEDYAAITSRAEKGSIIMDNSGRLGVNEVTRLGMKENEMREIANLLCLLYENGNNNEVHERAISLRKEFQTVRYC